MEDLKKLGKGMLKQRGIQIDKLSDKELLDEISKSPDLMRIAIALSGRVALLEKFITDTTDYNGDKVGYGRDRDKWKK